MAKASSGSVLYISHGGGPLPLLGDPEHAEMLDHLKEMAAMLEKPAAIACLLWACAGPGRAGV